MGTQRRGSAVVGKGSIKKVTLEERLERKSCQAGKEQTSILGRGNGTCQECKCSSPLCSGESEEFARLKLRKWWGMVGKR